MNISFSWCLNFFVGEPSTVATPSSQSTNTTASATCTTATADQASSSSQPSTGSSTLPEQTTDHTTPLPSQDEQNISSILEATHESLIPLEEGPHDLEELVADEDMEHHQLLSEVAHLARELGHVDQVDFVSDIIEEAMESVAVGDDDDSGGEEGELGIGIRMEDTSMEDSDLASVSDDEDEEDDDDEIYDDNCNSAGEEVMILGMTVGHTHR